MVDILYDKKWDLQSAINWLLGTTDANYEPGGSYAYITVPEEFNPSKNAIVPHYGIGFRFDTSQFYLAVLNYDDQSGQILFPVPVDANGNIIGVPIAVVFSVKLPDAKDFVRYAGLVEQDTPPSGSTPGIYNITRWGLAPQYMKVCDDNGNCGIIELGLGWLSALLIMGGLVVSGIASYGFLEYSKAKKELADLYKEVVEYAISKNNPQMILALVGQLGGIRIEHESGGSVVKSFTNALKEWLTPIAGLILTVIALMKLRMIIDVFRSVLGWRRR